MLSRLVSQRLSFDENFTLKMILNKAISIVGELTPQHLDALSLLFVHRYVKLPNVRNICDLKEEYKYIGKIFCEAKAEYLPYLKSLGLLELYLESFDSLKREIDSVYGFKKSDVHDILPLFLKLKIASLIAHPK